MNFFQKYFWDSTFYVKKEEKGGEPFILTHTKIVTIFQDWFHNWVGLVSLFVEVRKKKKANQDWLMESVYKLFYLQNPCGDFSLPLLSLNFQFSFIHTHTNISSCGILIFLYVCTWIVHFWITHFRCIGSNTFQYLQTCKHLSTSLVGR